MGKTEKLVVLAVLAGAALVLALALTRDGDEVEAANPLSGARQVLGLGDAPGGAGEIDPQAFPLPDEAALQAGTDEALPGGVSAARPDRPEGEAQGRAPSLLLNAGTESSANGEDAPLDGRLAGEPDQSALEPESDPTKPILVETSGLRPSFLEDYRMYTLAEGDTWSSLAQRFYRDGRYTRNLHLANEDLEELTPGKDILVPVFDFIVRDAGLQPASGAAPLAHELAQEAQEEASLPTSIGITPSSAPASTKPLEYVVRSGDTLSDISLSVFGTATRWKEILEANRDKLQKPESLQVGMKLRIPAGGKLPAAAKKPESKPKTTERGDQTAATGKKKKVL